MFLGRPQRHLFPRRTPSPSPARSPVPAGYRRDGLLVDGVSPVPAADSDSFLPSSPPRRAQIASMGSSVSPDAAGPPPQTIAELWTRLGQWDYARRVEENDRARLTAYALLRPPSSGDAALRRDLLAKSTPREMLELGSFAPVLDPRTRRPAGPC
ncbi:hypothetical protein ON010_g1254 [Phytophthora cinnamomi]|nr:hypothetical protein ON010_g1254 [Phytophthora cinnamomi]